MRKVIVLGLDGATFDVLLPRVERGEMPHLAALLESGVWGTLRSTTPPFSAQAWASMVTGQNQAKHGVVDFWVRTPDHSHRSFVTSQSIRSETLWHMAGRHGRKVGIVNVPVTYPPAPVNGYLVSGLLTPPGRVDFAYPAALREEILAKVPGYVPDPFDPLGASKRQILELETWMQKHEEICRYLLDRYPAGLHFSVVQALDHIQHLFWDEIVREAGQGRFAPLVDRCYRMVDDIIGHRRGLVREGTTLFLVSDHGFGAARKWFHVNRFLVERGLLALGQARSGGVTKSLARAGLTPQNVRALVRRLDVLGMRRRMGRLARVTLGRRIESALAAPVDWSRTQAIAGSPATEGIYVNLRGREPEGIVEPGQAYEVLRDRLIAELLALKDPETSGAVLCGAYRREELYEGPFLDQLPDVVFDFGDGRYLASNAPAATQVLEPLPEGFLQGRHRSNGLFVAAGPDIHRSGDGRVEGMRILDIAPTALYALDLPIPEEMDGRVALEIFGPTYRQDHPVRYERSEPIEPPGAMPDYDPEDTEEMERRLRGLGYVS